MTVFVFAVFSNCFVSLALAMFSKWRNIRTRLDPISFSSVTCDPEVKYHVLGLYRKLFLSLISNVLFRLKISHKKIVIIIHYNTRNPQVQFQVTVKSAKRKRACAPNTKRILTASTLRLKWHAATIAPTNHELNRRLKSTSME